MKKILIETLIGFFALSGFILIALFMIGYWNYDPTTGMESEHGREMHIFYGQLGYLVEDLLKLVMFTALSYSIIRYVCHHLKQKSMNPQQVGN